MEILIYDENLNRKGIIENHTSLIWTRKYFTCGNFELHAPITKQNLLLLSKGNIVRKMDSLEAGVIEYIENTSNNTKNEIIVKGRFLESYLDRRLIKNTFNFNGNVEDAMFTLLSSVIDIPLVELGLKKSYLDKVTFQVTMKNLLFVLEKLSKYSTIGFRCIPNFKDKKIVFECYKGIDRTISQDINSRVVFSESYNNLNKAIYRWDSQNLKTLVIVGGQGEGENRKYVTVGDGTGLQLRELFVDARDLSPDNISDEDYENALKQRGYDALTSKSISESFEYETGANINFIYKKNYDLGDIVTIYKQEWGIKVNKRITEIQEVYENSGMVIVPTLGEPLPEILDWSK